MEHKFEPFQKVLVRNSERMWSASFYSHYHKLADKHCTVTGLFSECIEYYGNEHLLGTTDNPEPKHEYKLGDYVEVYWAGIWNICVYIAKKGNTHVLYSSVDDSLYHAEYDEIRPLKEEEYD